ncbi:MAG: PaaI family thioesterase [Bacillota bacterium]|nr:PaaI family thioesterase [Bacillota bacterium]MDW7683579.1 PaaI family thioesterase [Bacillota bacterium]
MHFKARDEDFLTRITESFKKQTVMQTIQGQLVKVEPGEVHIKLPFSKKLTQQHGFIHAGILTTVVDSACGYAAWTLMDPEAEVLTVEYKVNFLLPAKGKEFLAVGRVVKPGRNLTVCTGEILVINGEECKTAAVMQATMMAIYNK